MTLPMRARLLGSLFPLLPALLWGCGDAPASSSTGGQAGSTTTTGSGGETTTGGTGGTGATTSAGGTGGVGGVGGTGATGGVGGSGGEGGGGSTGCVVRVNASSGNDVNDGHSWLLAKATVTSALAAVPGDMPCEVWVAQGTYKPTSTTDRTITIQLKPQVALYGGFAGNESSVEERDIAAHETILSGDIGVAGDSSDNSHHVVTGAEDARLDGFTVELGRSDATSSNRGGAGLLNVDGDITVANCLFRDNRAGDGLFNEVNNLGGPGGDGAGINHSKGALTITDCVFKNNKAGNGGPGTQIGGPGGGGAGLMSAYAKSVLIQRTRFESNQSGGGGDCNNLGGPGGSAGGAFFYSTMGPLLIVDSVFVSNTTGPGGASNLPGGRGDFGGLGIVSGAGPTLVASCTFDQNKAGAGAAFALLARMSSGGPVYAVNNVSTRNAGDIGAGGFLQCDGTVPVIIANNSFAGNSSVYSGGGFHYMSLDAAGAEPLVFSNNILWNNTAQNQPQISHGNVSFWTPVLLSIANNDIQGGCVPLPMNSQINCGANLDVDPLFVDSVAGDLHLSAGSPVKDQGDSSVIPPDVADLDADADTAEPIPVDRDKNPRQIGAGVDLGAFELP